jgi:hypothetical protein
LFLHHGAYFFTPREIKITIQNLIKVSWCNSITKEQNQNPQFLYETKKGIEIKQNEKGGVPHKRMYLIILLDHNT